MGFFCILIHMKRILLVEDDSFLQTLYLDLLKGEKYTVETAVDGLEAYEKIKKGGYDLILLDMIIPKLSGHEVIEKLAKTNPKSLKQNIIIMSNLDSSEMKSIEKYKFTFIKKSDVNPDEFLEKVSDLL
jgi:two-component system, OmpR family, response regulator VanR